MSSVEDSDRCVEIVVDVSHVCEFAAVEGSSSVYEATELLNVRHPREGVMLEGLHE
jgi:hypothetical protein